jgi:putative transposase
MWGSPRLVGARHTLGIAVAKSTVETYRLRPRKPPSPTWKAFLQHHVQDLVSLDCFVVPPLTHKVLFVLLILAYERRRVVHVDVTEHPTARWTAQQVVDAFSMDEGSRYLPRDRDRIYGAAFQQRVRPLGIEDVITAPRSPVTESLRRASHRQPLTCYDRAQESVPRADAARGIIVDRERDDG